MHDTTIVSAIEAALRTPAFCACGRDLVIAVHDGGAWLECRVHAEPARLPAGVARVIRELLHERRFVIEIDEPAPVPLPRGATSRTGLRVATSRA